MAKFTQQLAVAGWIALVITGSGVFLIWRTLIHTRDIVAEAHETTKAAIRTADEARDATKASERAADAAIRQADFAKESFERMERPYIFIKFGDPIHLKGSRGNKPFIRYNACQLRQNARDPSCHLCRAGTQYQTSVSDTNGKRGLSLPSH